MSKHYPYNLWISVGTDFGVSFATIGNLAKDSSMMQGILLSLQSLMSSEVQVTDSRFMTGQNEYVRFGTFTLNQEEIDVVVQYILKSNEQNELDDHDEQLAQQLALSFCKFIVMTPNFYENVESGRSISRDHVAKSFLNACTITKQKISVTEDDKSLIKHINSELKNAESDTSYFSTLSQLKEFESLLDENGLGRSYIPSFKRQLLLQLLAQDILIKLIEKDPFVLLEYRRPRYIIEEMVHRVENYIQNIKIDVKNIITEYNGNDLNKKANNYLKKLCIDEIHSADRFISRYLAIDILKKLTKKRPLLALKDFRDLKLENEIKKEIQSTTKITSQGDMICDALVEYLKPPILEKARLFYNSLINSFGDKRLPASVWSVITDFTFSLIDENDIELPKKTKKKRHSSSVEAKRFFIKEKMEELSLMNNSWKKELAVKFKETGLGKQLQIQNVEESVVFAAALEQAVISTMKKIFQDHLIDEEMGDIFDYIIMQYKKIAAQTVYGDLINNILLDLKNYEKVTRENISLSVLDLIESAIEEGAVKAYIKSIPVKRKKSFFRRNISLQYDGREITTHEVLKKFNVTIRYHNTVTPLPEIKKDGEFLVYCLAQKNILKRAYIKSSIRNSLYPYSDAIYQFQENIITRIDGLITLFQEQMVGDLKPAHILPEVKKDFPVFSSPSVPECLENKNFDQKTKEEWRDHSPKIHKILQDLISSFVELRSDDINYKKKAMKFYNSAIKDLKKVRNKLTNSWDKIKNNLEKELKKHSNAGISGLDNHFETVENEIENWIGEGFYINKLEPGKLTQKRSVCTKEVRNKNQAILTKNIGNLPKNFLEIGLSILLYKRIPDFVIEESYGQMISGDKHISAEVRKAWGKSHSRKEFESNLYLNMRVLGNALIKSIQNYSRFTHSQYIKNDIELSSVKKGFYIVIATIPKSIFKTKAQLSLLFTFDNLEFFSEGNNWHVRLFVEPEYSNFMNKYKDRLIVLSDIISFVARIKFEEKTEAIFDGIKAVFSYLIEHGDKNIIDFSESLKEAIFRLSDYPTITAEDGK